MGGLIKRVGNFCKKRKAEESEPQSSTRSFAADPAMHLFSDAINDRVNGVCPEGTSRGSIKKLSKFVDSNLRLLKRHANGEHATAFSNITYSKKAGKFKIDMGKNCEVYRSQSEIQLHIYLQSHLRQCESIGPDTVDALPSSVASDITGSKRCKYLGIARAVGSTGLQTSEDSVPNGAGSAAAGTHAEDAPERSERSMPTPIHAEPVEAVAANVAIPGPSNTADGKHSLVEPIATFDSKSVHFSSRTKEEHGVEQAGIDMMLKYHSHQQKKISDHDGGSWRRAAWLTTFTKNSRKPNEFKGALINKLGPEKSVELAADIENMYQMTKAIATSDLSKILTGMELANFSADLNNPSCLKLPEKNDVESMRAAEQSCERLTAALLEKAGISSAVLRSTDAGDRIRLASTLLRQLDTDSVIYSPALGRNGAPDIDQSTISVCARPGSELGTVKFEGDKNLCTALLCNAFSDMAAMINENGRYSLCTSHPFFIRYPS